MRIRTIAAFGVGYVLGARAGRRRYEQLKAWFERATSSPRGQAVRSRAEAFVGSGVDLARTTAANGLNAASDQVRKLGDL